MLRTTRWKVPHHALPYVHHMCAAYSSRWPILHQRHTPHQCLMWLVGRGGRTCSTTVPTLDVSVGGGGGWVCTALRFRVVTRMHTVAHLVCMQLAHALLWSSCVWGFGLPVCGFGSYPLWHGAMQCSGTGGCSTIWHRKGGRLEVVHTAWRVGRWVGADPPTHPNVWLLARQELALWWVVVAAAG